MFLTDKSTSCLLPPASCLARRAGHIYNISSFYNAGSTTGMAIHTALSFILLSCALLTTCAEKGWMRVVTRSQAGGLMARWLLPLVVTIPPLFGG